MSFTKNLDNAFTYFIEDEVLLNDEGAFPQSYIPSFYETINNADFKQLVFNLDIWPRPNPMDPEDQIGRAHV